MNLLRSFLFVPGHHAHRIAKAFESGADAVISMTPSDELAKLGPKAVGAVEYDGLLWISYPKKSSKVKTDLTRDVLWELMSDTGLRPVTQVSVDSTWSAMRFRPTEKGGE